jgi:hypothetical protein
MRKPMLPHRANPPSRRLAEEALAGHDRERSRDRVLPRQSPASESHAADFGILHVDLVVTGGGQVDVARDRCARMRLRHSGPVLVRRSVHRDRHGGAGRPVSVGQRAVAAEPGFRLALARALEGGVLEPGTGCRDRQVEGLLRRWTGRSGGQGGGGGLSASAKGAGRRRRRKRPIRLRAPRICANNPRPAASANERWPCSDIEAGR